MRYCTYVQTVNSYYNVYAKGFVYIRWSSTTVGHNFRAARLHYGRMFVNIKFYSIGIRMYEYVPTVRNVFVYGINIQSTRLTYKRMSGMFRSTVQHTAQSTPVSGLVWPTLTNKDIICL